METSTSQGAVAAHPPAASAIALAAAEQGEARARRGSGSPVAGLLWMALASALFALMNVGARLASERVPWPEVAAARAILGAVTAMGIGLLRGAPLRVDPRDRGLAWARALCGTAAMVCTFFTLGAPALALGDVVTLGATSPIFVALLAPRLLGEKSSRGLWLATLGAFGGVALVAGPQIRIAGHLALIATAGALASALAMIWLRKLGSSGRHVGSPGAGAPPGRPIVPAGPEAIALHFSLVASAAMVVVSVPTFEVPDGRGALLLVGTGVTGGLAQLAMTRAYALDQAARVGTVGYLGVALSHVLGAVALREAPGPYQVAGATLVTAAGVGLTLGVLRAQGAVAGGARKRG